MSQPVLLEICVASVDDAMAAVAHGADRLEVNSALELGGLTPSAGMFAEIRRRVAVPLIAMVRPRPGGFCYSESDFDVMLNDAVDLLAAGADGLAFGVLTASGEVDAQRCRRLRELCGDRAAVFHRAFDVTRDPRAALDALIDLQFTRAMTSGQSETAVQGADLIAELSARAATRIEIMPAAGINASTAGELIARTGCRQIHASARGKARDTFSDARPRIRFGSYGPEDGFVRTDPDAVAALRAAISDQRGASDIVVRPNHNGG
jgi:copper homeostasis protein